MIASASNPVWVFVCLLLLFSTPCFGQQDEPQGSNAGGPEIEVVIRFSKQLFESLTQQTIEMNFPIDRTVEGMAVTGTVDATGQTKIELLNSADGAEFVISVPGIANASFHTDAGPAIAYASSVSNFTSEKRIRFDGENFIQGPTTASAQSCACVDRICPKRSGPIGKVVKKAGWCIARNNIEKIRSAVDEAAEEIVAQTFDEKATDLLEMLNQISVEGLDEIVAKYFPETTDHIDFLATLSDSIVAGAGPPGAQFPKLPPAAAHVELWLKTRPLEAAFLELLVQWNVAHDVLKTFVSKEEAKLILEDLTIETMDGWTVLRIGVKKKEDK